MINEKEIYTSDNLTVGTLIKKNKELVNNAFDKTFDIYKFITSRVEYGKSPAQEVKSMLDELGEQNNGLYELNCLLNEISIILGIVHDVECEEAYI